MFAYWLHLVTVQLNSIRSLIFWIRYKLPVSERERAEQMISKYDDICEEIAELFAEINKMED